MTNASILTIGDELLIGQVIDTNSAWIGRQMSLSGISIRIRIAVGDTEQAIITGLDSAKQSSDIVIMTGGLGPTRDDITKQTLCRYFGGKMILNEAVLTDVTNFFARLNRPLLESNRKQAEVPDCCTVIRNPWGTAPGMWFEKEGKIFISLPGVPNEMKNLMSEFIIPELKKRFRTPLILHRNILTAGIGESFLSEMLQDFEDQLPSYFKLAYLPNLSQVRLRLTALSENKEEVSAEMEKQVKKLKAMIEPYIFGFEEDTLEKVIGDLLRERKQTLSLAESCTGGYIAHKITSVPGSSDYFPGSVVSYAYEVKESLLNVKKETLENFGAVSEETVMEMSEGCLNKFKTDYSIAVSGIAGPGGGTPDKPVGTVWVAVRNKSRVHTKKFIFFRDRLQNIEMTYVAALNLLKKFILKEVE